MLLDTSPPRYHFIDRELFMLELQRDQIKSVNVSALKTKWTHEPVLSLCIDLMKLKRIIHKKKKAAGNKTEEKTQSVMSALTPGLCFDFHPTVSYKQKLSPI